MSRERTQFRKGTSGNYNGRPKGSRNKLSQKFLADIEKHWKKHGKEILESVRVLYPAIYLRIVANLISKDVQEDYPENTEDEESAKERLIKLILENHVEHEISQTTDTNATNNEMPS